MLHNSNIQIDGLMRVGMPRQQALRRDSEWSTSCSKIHAVAVLALELLACVGDGHERAAEENQKIEGPTDSKGVASHTGKSYGCRTGSASATGRPWTDFVIGASELVQGWDGGAEVEMESGAEDDEEEDKIGETDASSRELGRPGRIDKEEADE